MAKTDVSLIELKKSSFNRNFHIENKKLWHTNQILADISSFFERPV